MSVQWREFVPKGRKLRLSLNLLTIGLAIVLYASFAYRTRLIETRYSQLSVRITEELLRLSQFPRIPKVLQLEDSLDKERTELEDGQIAAREVENKTDIISFLALLAGSGGLLFEYLQSEESEPKAQQQAVGGSNTELASVITTERAEFHVADKSELAVSDKLPLKMGKAVSAQERKEKLIKNLYLTSQRRLEKELNALGRRANTNLVIGVVITLLGIGVLIYLVTRPHQEFTNVTGVLSYYIPRVTTIALAQTFAYFFLRLYRANLEEIRYYQNEKTTLAALELAWRISPWPDPVEATMVVSGQLANLDRNASTTSNCQKAKSDQVDGADIATAVLRIVADSLKGKDKG